MQVMPGRYPATIAEYLPASRQCRVAIPGITDGADVLPLAEIEYPIGDKASHDNYATELNIFDGDTVWVEFICGDSRYPIITGYRNPNVGNDVEWRRFQHANIELLADDTLQLITTDGKHRVTINESGVTVHTDANATVTTGGNASVAADGNIDATAGGELTVTAGGNAAIEAAGQATVDAQQVVMNGGSAGGVVCQTHVCSLTGMAHPQGSASVMAGN